MNYLNPRTMEKSEGLRPSDLSPVATVPQESIVQEQGYNTSQDNDISVPENVILQTRNFGMFKFDPLNRAIRQDRLDRLYDAVKEKNLLHLFPIIVTRDFVIIDGQHRFKVAQALDTSIYYIVSRQMRIEDAAKVVTNTAAWRPADFLDHWCKVGLPDYIRLNNFIAANQFFTITAATQLCAFGGKNQTREGESLTQAFSGGRYKINDMAFAAKVTGMVRDFQPRVTFAAETTFLRALTNLAANPSYDHKRMMMKMEYLSTRLVKCPDVPTYLRVFEDIYNYRVTEASKVHFQIMNASHIKKR